MQKMTVDDVVKATGATLISGNPDTELSGITTDSRAAKEGMLFIPLVGDRFDAHDFIDSALNAGTTAVLTHKDMAAIEGKAIIRVKDTKIALGDIAKYYKHKYNVPTVAVTGSVGKTTTKDMLYSVLAQKYKTLKTQGNFNNNIGLPLTVLGLESEHEAAVLEMGMNHFGEIDYLANIAKPDAAVVTNIGMSHIENLGSREGIFKAKMEVTAHIKDGGTLIVNGDDDYLSKAQPQNGVKLMRYGIDNPQNDVFAEDVNDMGTDGIEFTAVVDGAKYRVKVNNAGIHNVYNALAAICVGKVFGVSMDACLRGIEECEYTAMRMEISKHGGVTVINDCYNASPDSIRAALKVLGSAKCERRIAVLGDVLEMGDFALKAHYDLGKSVVESGADVLITAGTNAAQLAKGAKDNGMSEVYSFEVTAQAADKAASIIKSGDVILIKASRGMHFEEIYKAVCAKAQES